MEKAEEPIVFSEPNQVERYWRSVMNNTTLCPPLDASVGLPPIETSLYSTLRSKSAWYHNYHLLKPQHVFLTKTIDLGLDAKVVDNRDLLQQISWASLTPVWILQRFYERRFQVKSIESISRSVKVKDPNPSTSTTEEKILTVRQSNVIKRKARQAQLNRLKEFDDTIEAYFDQHNLEGSYRSVITEALAKVKRGYGRGELGITLKRIGQMFDDVIEAHEEGGDYTRVVKGNKKNIKKEMLKTKGAEEAEGEDTKNGRDAVRSRKAVMGWTKARDELLRDAIVILRCRDKYRNQRKNWSALSQVLPEFTPTSRTARYEQVRQAVGEEAYLNQLEVEWGKLWSQFRGTDQLADPNPRDPNDFNLMEHINFLRAHIDKFSVAEKVDNETGDPLPLDGS